MGPTGEVLASVHCQVSWQCSSGLAYRQQLGKAELPPNSPVLGLRPSGVLPDLFPPPKNTEHALRLILVGSLPLLFLFFVTMDLDVLMTLSEIQQ